MRVKVKLVVFRHPEPAKWGTYCSYCPELQYFFGRGETEKAVVDSVKTYLLQELYHRERYANLKICGWEITKDSIKVPTFTEEEAVRLTEESYELKINEYKILEIDVEVPEPRNLW